jgi:hypothetical protein
MEIKIEEWDNFFYIALLPDTVADAALLTRLKMNTKKEAANIAIKAYETGDFFGQIKLQKLFEQRNEIK